MASALQEPRPVPKPEDRIKALVELANVVTADDAVPIKRYWLSGKQILRMANVYMDEKNLEKCFILYMKYVILYIEQLPKHADYKQADPTEKAITKNNCTKIIPLAEEVKSRIKKSYQKEYDAYLQEKEEYDAKLKARQQLLQKQLAERTIQQQREQKDHYLSNFQLELDKKKRELAEGKIRPTTSTSVPEPSAPSFEENTNGYQSNESSFEEDDDEQQPLSAELSNKLSISEQDQILVPQVDRSTKPTLYEVESDQLCQLIVPFKSIIDKFASISRANTNRNVETCAILGGELSHNCFTITHLLVPKQSGTSDTCAAYSEEELAVEQERLQLITVGWIHTHPSQRSFLSSVDLHTHAPYQKMLPEAVAIVVAPSANEVDIFSLSEPGLDSIMRCRQKGFHPHPNEGSLYGKAKHVRIDDTLHVQVVDLR